MKKIINFSMNNKFAIWILTIMVVAAGLYSGLNMKQETMPDITVPNVSVMTVYPGAAPNEVAEEVTEPIEQRIENLDGVDIVNSSSFANSSSVQIQYNFDKDMDEAVDEVKNALSDLTFPDGVEDPQISRLSLNAFPVLALSISDADHSLEHLTTVVEDNVLPELEGIEGLADVQMTGQQVQEVSINFNEEKLSKYGLTEETIKQLIQGSDVSFPLGLTNFNGELKNLVIDGNIETLKDLKALEIPAVPNQSGQSSQQNAMSQQGQGQAAQGNQQAQASMEMPTVQLDDLADIKVVKRAESISRTNGEESIGIQIVKATDANTVEVVNSVKDSINKLEDEYGLTITTTMDQGEPIEKSVETMLSKALFGALFAVVIILLFLRSFKTTLISIVSIPLSLLMAIFLLNQMDITLNIMTLGALTVAIGRVIDDSIVVIENIYRRMAMLGEELRGKALVREATREMFVPIFSSTVVTIAVFLPLGLVSGQVGEMFLPFALAVVFALSASLIVAVTIVPMLAHSMFNKGIKRKTKDIKHHDEKPGKLARFYKGILNWTLNHKLITFGGSVIVLVASFFLVPLIGVSFLPNEEQKMVVATYSPEPGQTREEVEDIALDAEEFISDREGVTTYQYSIGSGGPMSGMMGGSDNSALFFIEYDSEFANFSGEAKKVVTSLNDTTDAGEWGTVEFASMGSNELQLFVYGDNMKDIQSSVEQIMPIMQDHDELEDVESSISEAYDQYTLVANQEKLSKYGLTAGQIGMNLSDNGESPVLTTVKNDGEELNVYVEVEKQAYDNIDDVKNTEIETPLGTSVAIEDVMEVEEGKSPDTIQRRQGKMYASITAKVTGDDAAGVSADIENEVNELTLPSGAKAEFGGVTEQINESFTQLGLAMLAAITIVYFVLVVTFGGALAPLAILFSLPFSIIGGLVALWIANEPLSVSAMIGALMLIGIVVTNAIVLIDRVIHKEKEGLSTREALLEAGSVRLRPILMTALATIGALIPLAIGAEGGGLISKGLGVTVIGGLTSSTLLTLVIVPIVYETFAKFRKKKLVKNND
ncbi:efflux RND transporter permease subunit [Virgibacillus ndiopensis]|uniref:efflux RND transporter permease subunit n=1 Tax=Virgibacillus ndiopensis TaxID=2004408 RepID=UPI000C07CB48|nr:efflux RND transporter permease subunit [Virgibacillus ndiopensis]